ncbi:hypothetical protein ACFV98_38780 [Streptomyces violascens]|uniref:hypothetical protein n=1 Tax=Streptomyces violascens TaxID=67381 RepID=UPI0036482D4C
MDLRCTDDPEAAFQALTALRPSLGKVAWPAVCAGAGPRTAARPRIGLRENDFHALADFADSPDTSRTTG